MTLTEALQFYAPLVGLVGLAFWSGVLSQRVRGLEKSVGELKDAVDEVGGTGERLVRLEVKMETANASLEKIDRTMQGLQRQLANMISGKGRIIEFGAEHP